MFAVAGRWRFDAALFPEREVALRDIAAGVRTLPGFVRGFWSRDVVDPSLGQTYIVFETRSQAEDFRRSVEQNSARQAASGVTPVELALLAVEADA